MTDQDDRFWESEFPAEGSALQYSEAIGRDVRTGPWADQQTSTYEKLSAAIDSGDVVEANRWVDFCVTEASVIHGYFRQLVPDALAFMVARGFPEEELRVLDSRVLGLLSLPDGRPFDAGTRWSAFQELAAEMRSLCSAGSFDQAGRLAPDLRDAWRELHDRETDHLYGLVTAAAERFGEAWLGELWTGLMEPTFASRYARFNTEQFPWEASLATNVYLAFESMRAHLSGPGRRGDVEFTEDEDRYSLSFAPCGTGGRALDGDQLEQTPSRVEAPYNFGITKEEHDFAWNKKGICYYCTNCCVVMQQMPIDRFGYPIRVVDPPTYPVDGTPRCTWHVYKDSSAVPARYYEDVGRDKPAEGDASP